LIVQTVSGQSFESYIQEHIYDPLEMQHSFTSLDRAAEAGMARGHMVWFGIPIPKDVPFNRGGLPNGFLICSAEDMAHYLTAQLNDGSYGNASVLAPQDIAAMHAPAVRMKTPEGSYGMGWEIGQIEGVPAVFHSGDNANFQAHVLMLPTEKLGVVVLLNAQGLSINTGAGQIARGVLAVATGRQPKAYTFPVEGAILPVGSVLVPVALSLVWIGWMLFRFLRRQKQGLPARRRVGWYGRVVVLPLVVDLGLLWVLLMGVPRLWGAPLSVMAAFFPDLFTLLMGGVVALGVWGVARTLLTLRPAKSSRPAVSQLQAVS
jgi:hypothetical protein